MRERVGPSTDGCLTFEMEMHVSEEAEWEEGFSSKVEMEGLKAEWEEQKEEEDAVEETDGLQVVGSGQELGRSEGAWGKGDVKGDG